MKMVLKVPMVCKKCKSCVLQIASKIKGIKSLTYDEEKSTLTVIGEVDVVVIVDALRKGKHPATVMTVSDEKKEAEEKKKKEDEEKKKKEEAEKKKKEEEERKRCLEQMGCYSYKPCPSSSYPYPYKIAVDDCPGSCTIV